MGSSLGVDKAEEGVMIGANKLKFMSRTPEEILASDIEYKPCGRDDVPMHEERLCVMQTMMKAVSHEVKEFDNLLEFFDVKIIVEDSPYEFGVYVRIVESGEEVESKLIKATDKIKIMKKLYETGLKRLSAQMVFNDVRDYIAGRNDDRERWRRQKFGLTSKCKLRKYYVPGDPECPCNVLQRKVREEFGLDFDEEAFL